MKKVFSLLIVLSILIACFPFMSGASYIFTPKTSYIGNFSDVSESDWFYPYVKECFEYGLMKGSSDTTFSPNSNLTLAEAITIASRIRSFYTTGHDLEINVALNETWYSPFVNYAIRNKIITASEYNYDAVATRIQVAKIFAYALPEDFYTEIISIPDNYIPDVPKSLVSSKYVYTLYRAGILSGSDSSGTFNPDNAITRSEIATIVTRIVNPERRIKSLPQKNSETSVFPASSSEVLSPEEISKKCADAVFYIECYSRNGELSVSASGFFISKDGYAVTNSHVIRNAGFIEIKMLNGQKYSGRIASSYNTSNLKIIDFDEEKDIALLKIDGGEFPYIEVGDSSNISQGQTVYAIGSPLGLENTMSYGIISQPKLYFENHTRIQISVPITHGSSGGALINASGQAIGITTGGIQDAAANLNWAVPIHEIKTLDKVLLSPDKLESDEHNLIRHLTGPFDSTWLPLTDDIIDFGTFSGCDELESAVDLTSGIYRYDLYDFHDSFGVKASENFATSLMQYIDAMEIVGFTLKESKDNNNNNTEIYFEKDGVSVAILIQYENTDELKYGLYLIYEYTPVYYEKYPTVLDFGFITALSPAKAPEFSDGYYIITYNWKNSYSEKAALILVNEYFKMIQNSGFTFYRSKLNNPEITTSNDYELRIFSSSTNIVGIAMDNNNFYIYIGKR